MPTPNSTPEITVTATINAPKHTVWECYTEPEHIIHWNFAGDDWCCPRATNDMVIGGRYVARMERNCKPWSKAPGVVLPVLPPEPTGSLILQSSKCGSAL